ncbi:lysosomal-associated transmembrane protein 4B [Diorhabda sublineata]|uniref:lysosomal-associated transmembrane protein 4B n=1 Tax=Diorhabda sublineata TaxID=1163346 RepID=UPI0024E08021|nr:lysosomal-associated transmembrane protein 4B [Diorhabda sublineata]
MFTMRLKLGSDRNKEWTCFFCLHVRTATILFGIWHLVLHILALVVLALMMRNHHVLIQKNEELQNDFLPTPLSKKDDDNPYYLPTSQDSRKIYSADIDMGALMTVCTLSITLLMVYGTIKGKPTHVLPFFCLQLFDFAITALTATGYFCYIRSAHRLVAENWNLPLRHELLQLSPQVLTLIVLLAFLFSMLWKAYWISVVWRLYKYLTFRQQSNRNAIHYIIPESDHRGLTDPDYPVLFRDQEASFGLALKQTPPPSYQDIMDEQPPPYPNTTQVVQETPNRFRMLGISPTTENQEPSTSAESINVTSVIETSVEVTNPISPETPESQHVNQDTPISNEEAEEEIAVVIAEEDARENEEQKFIEKKPTDNVTSN